MSPHFPPPLIRRILGSSGSQFNSTELRDQEATASRVWVPKGQHHPLQNFPGHTPTSEILLHPVQLSREGWGGGLLDGCPAWDSPAWGCEVILSGV